MRRNPAGNVGTPAPRHIGARDYLVAALTAATVFWVCACTSGEREAGGTSSAQTERHRPSHPPPGSLARIEQAWDLPASGGDVPEFITAVARCGEEFYLVDRRLALVYQTRLDGTGRRIGAQGDGEGQFREPTGIALDCDGRRLFVVDITGISVFMTDTGRFVRRFPRPEGFTNRGDSVRVDTNGNAVETSGIWPRDMNADWRAGGNERALEGFRFGARLDLASGTLAPMFEPLALACGTLMSSCWEIAFDRLDGSELGWVFAHRQIPIVALVSPRGVTRTFRVQSPRFRRDGQTVRGTAPLDQQIAWTEANSEIFGVSVIRGKIGVVHALKVSKGWRPGAWIQLNTFLNLYTLDGTPVEVDIPLPGLTVGRDGDRLFVVDYGSTERRAGAPARLVAVGIGP